MHHMKRGGEIEGHIDIFFANGDNNEEIQIFIHGDAEGLRSFAKLLLELANLNQEGVNDQYLTVGAREHYQLRPGLE